MSDVFRVYKFGGASVKDAQAVQNVVNIIRNYAEEPMVVVVSAMGKMTNALEEVVAAVMANDESRIHNSIQVVVDFHRVIGEELFSENHPVWETLEGYFNQLRTRAALHSGESYGAVYDRLICFGEFLSTQIIQAVLLDAGLNSRWHNAQELVITNGHHRRATVDFTVTEDVVRKSVAPEGIHIVQGFLGATAEGTPTTLGREGSDYTAAVLAYVLDASEVCIWKDVPGVLTGDPKVFSDVIRLETISFREAIELAYYGASVIHPKTIQPLQRKEIPLRVRSFVNPDEPGTVIQKGKLLHPMSPCFIRKGQQALITLSTRDLAFIVEDHLSKIYNTFHELGIAVNLMQNSAVSSSFSINHDPILLNDLLEKLREDFVVKHNTDLCLYTVRHYDEKSTASIRSKGEVFLEQVTRHTHQFVVKE
ncbi:aspartate kinase [Phaeocystidibacter luteus]|uniref:Aspartokinase n=1 Tax=Phaeocystidibacter luteus TaxID=911197 RepID=A0A6N6RHB0_9FLAO|nr:aspartate kinase [Phaeocystidibacter luteus]KAB2809845.1 aspartate kinase [Phaeocystidibacter luteus]